MTTVSLLIHPVDELVTVKKYVLVEVGFTLGLALVDVNPLGEDVQAYVIPVTEEEPIEVEPPLQILASAPAFAIGSGLTVITTVSLLVQPVAVLVDVKK